MSGNGVLGPLAGPDDPRERAIAELIEEVGLELRVAMHRAGVSQQATARRLGKSQSHVSSALGGSRNMTLRTLAEIAWAAGLTIEFDFTVDPAASQPDEWTD